MNTKNIMKEYSISDVTDANVPEIVTKLLSREAFTGHPFIEKYFENYRVEAVRRESAVVTEKGQTRGQTVSDSTGAGVNMQVAATLEILNSVIRGYNRYMSDVWVRKYTTDNVVFKIPLTEYVENADDIDAVTAALQITNKEIDYATIDLSNPESERGARVTWTRNAIEDVTFDLQGEMLEGLGFAIAVKQMRVILATLGTVLPADMPNGSVITITNPITWSQFLQVIGAVDTGKAQGDGTFKTYGPADYCLVSPDVYWQLFEIIQLTNVLYQGSTEPVRNGIIRLALGTTLVKMSLLPAGTIYAVNSAKAIAMATRRELKLEPIYFPERNRYGFVGTVRFGTSIIYPAAIQKGSI